MKCGIIIASTTRAPALVRAGWWWHTDKQTEGEFFRATITHGGFR